MCRKAAPARSAARCRHPARQGQPCRSPGERPARVAVAGRTAAPAEPAGRRRTPTREGVQCRPGRARRPAPGRDRSPRARGLAAWRPPKRRWGRSYPQQRRGWGCGIEPVPVEVRRAVGGSGRRGRRRDWARSQGRRFGSDPSGSGLARDDTGIGGAGATIVAGDWPGLGAVSAALDGSSGSSSTRPVVPASASASPAFARVMAVFAPAAAVDHIRDCGLGEDEDDVICNPGRGPRRDRLGGRDRDCAGARLRGLPAGGLAGGKRRRQRPRALRPRAPPGPRRSRPRRPAARLRRPSRRRRRRLAAGVPPR